MHLAVPLPARGRYRFDVVGFGLNTTDLLAVVSEYPQPDTKQAIRSLEYSPGGQAATAMATCARLGWAARYIGCFGGDANASEGRESLLRFGVDLTAARTVEDSTNAFSLIIVDERTGNRTVLWSRHPGLTFLAADVQADAVCSGRVLLVDCHETAASTAAAGYAQLLGIPTVIDVERVRPGIEELLQRIDVIITAEAFPAELTGISDPGKSLRALAETYRPAMVCMTLGSKGSLALVDGVEIRTRGYRVPVIDTTGAGDVFRGGFIAGWLRGGATVEVEEVMEYANATAALKCRSLGARTGIPRPTEVDALLRSGDRTI